MKLNKKLIHWALHLSSRRRTLKSSDKNLSVNGALIETANRLIGIQYDGYELRHPLFYVRNWPDELRSDYIFANTPKAKAAVAVRRLEHLLKHGV